MIRIKRNPHLEDIENYIKTNSDKFNYINEGIEGLVYYFKLNKRLVINTEILQPGEYVLKIPHDKSFYYSVKNINILKLLSRYGLIPKVFIITNNYIIMKYISATNYGRLSKKEKININSKLQKIFEVWKRLGFEKYIDREGDNILVSNDLKHVYIIDPFLHYD